MIDDVDRTGVLTDRKQHVRYAVSVIDTLASEQLISE